MAQLIFQKAQKFSVNGLTEWIWGLSKLHAKISFCNFSTRALVPRVADGGVDGILFRNGVNWGWVKMRHHHLVIIIVHLFYAEFYFT